jgi:ubiquinone/menaquinone biosynthesis C-methylase UbiE
LPTKRILTGLHFRLARSLIRLGAFIQSSAVMVLTADELAEFGRRYYARRGSILGWNRDDLVDSGFVPEERSLLERLPIRTGRMLVLGLGGGREAIPFAKMGFEVTGVDFIPEMVQNAVTNAKRHGVKIRGIVQDISTLDLPGEPFDVAWLSAAMYSCIPTSRRRIEMIRRIGHSLKEEGYFACQFHWNERRQSSKKVALLRRLLALLTLGNLTYQDGDSLWANAEFIHAFSSEDDLRREFAAAGFRVVWLNVPTGQLIRGEALLRKAGAQSAFSAP